MKSKKNFEKDRFSFPGGDVEITFLGHGTLMLDYSGKIIHVDPVKDFGNYAEIPKGDIILITHAHPDHLDKKALELASKEDTTIILNPASRKKIGSGTSLKNGEKTTLGDITIEAVPAYNVSTAKKMFHPKDRDNGYIITFSGNSGGESEGGDSEERRIYIAGDTEPIPEMKELPEIEIAFLPMNLPFTMSPEQAAKAAEMIKPKVFYPYHFGKSDTEKLKKLMENTPEVEVRIRDLA